MKFGQPDKRIAASLRLINKVYKEILDDSANIVLPQAAQNVEVTKANYDANKEVAKSWGYVIDAKQPLRFKTSAIRDLALQPEIYCDMQWTDDKLPVKQEIKVRVWSSHGPTIYNQSRDSEEILNLLTEPRGRVPRRVVLRFHLDRAATDADRGSEYHPEYHLQIGGKPEEDELCWHPKKVNIPRLCHHPMELFLTCQMVAANFFWDEYVQIRERREWQDMLCFYQQLVLEDYYRRCLQSISENMILIDQLVS